MTVQLTPSVCANLSAYHNLQMDFKKKIKYYFVSNQHQALQFAVMKNKLGENCKFGKEFIRI